MIGSSTMKETTNHLIWCISLSFGTYYIALFLQKFPHLHPVGTWYEIEVNTSPILLHPIDITRLRLEIPVYIYYYLIPTSHLFQLLINPVKYTSNNNEISIIFIFSLIIFTYN